LTFIAACFIFPVLLNCFMQAKRLGNRSDEKLLPFLFADVFRDFPAVKSIKAVAVIDTASGGASQELPKARELKL